MAKKEADLDNEIQAQSAHKDKVKVLKAQLKANKSKRVNAQWDKMNADAEKMGRAIDKTKAKRMSEINKSGASKGRQLLEKLHLNQTAQKMHEATIYKVENDYISARRKDKAGWRKKADEVTFNWAKGVDERYARETKGKGVIESIKTAMKIDREESRRLVENLIEAEANYYD